MSDALQSVLLILFALFLVLLNGFFVAAEFALVKVRATRIEELVARGTFGAKKTQEAVRHLDAYLSATQFGITLASLGLGYVGEPAFHHLIEPLFGGLSPWWRNFIAFGIAFTVITALHIIIGELAPKSLAIQRAERVTLAVIYPLDFFYRLFRWPIAFLNWVAGLVLRLFGLTPTDEHGPAEAHSEEEVRLILTGSHQGGEITDSELTLVNNVFDFTQRQAWEVMVPRPDIVFLSTNKSLAENARRADESDFTRLPLVEENSPDEIIGMIHIRDLVRIERQQGGGSDSEKLRHIARDLPRIPETKQIDQLLREFQRERQHMAIVVDEYGGTAGIVTIEDIIEEIVGDIQDEFDRTTPEMEPSGADCYNVDARMPLSKLERTLNLEGEETEVDTIGGWFLSKKGAAPLRLGDSIPYGEATVTITELAGRRVRKVRVCVPEGRENKMELERSGA